MARRAAMAWKLALACRLAKACDVAYYVDRPGGVTACPSYGDVRFTDVPDVAISGVERTDAGLVGSCADCVIVAFRGTLPLSFDSGSALLPESARLAQRCEGGARTRPRRAGAWRVRRL